MATPSRDEHGRATVILSRGPWVREIVPEQLAEALAEAKAVARDLTHAHDITNGQRKCAMGEAQ